MHGDPHRITIATRTQQPIPLPLVWLRRAFGLAVLTLLVVVLTPLALLIALLWLAKAMRLIYPMARSSILSTADGIADAAFPRR